MSNENDRELKEYLNLFSDPKYAKRAWQTLIGKSLVAPSKSLPEMYDKDGNVRFESAIDTMAYKNVKQRLKENGIGREPMAAELAIECAVIRMRFDNGALTIIRDSTGAKPVDESKIDQTVNDYTGLTDEELEVLAAMRAKKAEVSSDSPSCKDEVTE